MLKRATILFVLGLIMASATVMAQTSVTPRDYGSVFLFDNDTGTIATKLGITFKGNMSVGVEDVFVFGGSMATLVASSNYLVWIQATVVPGGTLVLVVPEVDAEVVFAFWF